MERRGIYRKGSAGHARNISSYKYYKENFRKWRLPLSALFIFALVFGMTPGTGEQFQTSLLTADQTSELAGINPDQGRKVLASALSSFLHDCERFKVDICLREGSALMTEVANPAYALPRNIIAVENFATRFERDVARAACKFDLGNAIATIKSAQHGIKTFVDNYGDMFDADSLSAQVKQLEKSVADMDGFVDSCFAR